MERTMTITIMYYEELWRTKVYFKCLFLFFLSGSNMNKVDLHGLLLCSIKLYCMLWVTEVKYFEDCTWWHCHFCHHPFKRMCLNSDFKILCSSNIYCFWVYSSLFLFFFIWNFATLIIFLSTTSIVYLC